MATLHRRKLIIGNMLERNIQISANLLLARHNLDNLIGEVSWIGVVQTHPLKLLNPAKTLQKLGQLTLTVDVDTIVCRILRYNHNLPNALGHQRLGLGNKSLHRHRLMATTN